MLKHYLQCFSVFLASWVVVVVVVVVVMGGVYVSVVSVMCAGAGQQSVGQVWAGRVSKSVDRSGRWCTHLTHPFFYQFLCK